jgi:hypothetical protein
MSGDAPKKFEKVFLCVIFGEGSFAKKPLAGQNLDYYSPS